MDKILPQGWKTFGSLDQLRVSSDLLQSLILHSLDFPENGWSYEGYQEEIQNTKY